MDCDVLIVGGRVSGASLALLLAQRGQRVLLVDRDTFPSDTLSTHFMGSWAVRLLDRLGVLAEVEAAVFAALLAPAPMSRIVSLRGRGDPGGAYSLAPRRDVLDAILIAAAQRAGVDFHAQTRVEGLIEEDGRVVGAYVRTAQEDCSTDMSALSSAPTAATRRWPIGCTRQGVSRGATHPTYLLRLLPQRHPPALRPRWSLFAQRGLRLHFPSGRMRTAWRWRFSPRTSRRSVPIPRLHSSSAFGSCRVWRRACGTPHCKARFRAHAASRITRRALWPRLGADGRRRLGLVDPIMAVGKLAMRSHSPFC